MKLSTPWCGTPFTTSGKETGWALFLHPRSPHRAISEENKLLSPYPTRLKNVTTLPCKMYNFFIWLRVWCIPPNVGGSEKSHLWVGIIGSTKNRLWCVANGMSSKQRYSKCSKWPPSAWIHASSLFHHWWTASSTTFCWAWNPAMSQQDASTTRPYCGLVLESICEKKTKMMKKLCILQGSAGTFLVWW